MDDYSCMNEDEDDYFHSSPSSFMSQTRTGVLRREEISIAEPFWVTRGRKGRDAPAQSKISVSGGTLHKL